MTTKNRNVSRQVRQKIQHEVQQNFRPVFSQAKGARAGEPMRIAGLMSGTSADGIDVAVVDISPAGMEMIAFGTVPFKPALRRGIFELFASASQAGRAKHSKHSGPGTVETVCRMNFALGEAFAQAIIDTCLKNKVPLGSLDLIGSHGQTVCHLPNNAGGSTLQIGEPCVIAERTGVTTIADFRTRDIAAGGQGAPLVPYTDWILFGHKSISRAIQNIGGIANVTYLPAGGTIDDVQAFDSGPGNMIIDRLASLATNGRLSYDKDGQLAGRGVVDEKLLDSFLRRDAWAKYFKRRPPKTTGRELFGIQAGDEIFAQAGRDKIKPADLLATATAFTARSIADAYGRFLGQVDEIILCGGGARNPVLVNMLREQFLKKSKVSRVLKAQPPGIGAMDEYGINADAKEAISFAILAYLTWLGLCGNAPSATGARHGAVLGKIVPGQAAVT
jgi:anhydro-N-acetylmuramic acid kinase